MTIREELVDEALPKGRRRGRAVVALCLFATMLVNWAMVVAMFQGLPVIGQVAWASDVDKKVQAAVEPIEQQIGKMQQAVDKQSAVANALMASVAASQVRATYARLCGRSSETERERLSADLDRYTGEYESYAGRKFPMDSLRCSPN